MSKSEKSRIDIIVTKAERVIGGCQPSVDSICLHLLRGKLEMVWSDNSHDLHGQLRSQLIHEVAVGWDCLRRHKSSPCLFHT